MLPDAQVLLQAQQALLQQGLALQQQVQLASTSQPVTALPPLLQAQQEPQQAPTQPAMLPPQQHQQMSMPGAGARAAQLPPPPPQQQGQQKQGQTQGQGQTQQSQQVVPQLQQQQQPAPAAGLSEEREWDWDKVSFVSTCHHFTPPLCHRTHRRGLFWRMEVAACRSACACMKMCMGGSREAQLKCNTAQIMLNKRQLALLYTFAVHTLTPPPPVLAWVLCAGWPDTKGSENTWPLRTPHTGHGGCSRH